MEIASRKIGEDYPPFVIAEIGINHGGNIDTAKHMVRCVAQSGAECVKHQTHFIEDEMTEEAKEIFPPNATKSIWEIMEECSLTKDEEVELKQYAESLGLIYLSTPFSRSAADFLAEIGVAAFKIGSGECDNLPLVRHISEFGLPVVMSTGMQTIASLESSVSILRNAGLSYALLECTNLYPSPPENVSLQGVTQLKEAFPDAHVGFSDHSIGPEMALASIALGSCIIERHFTDDRYRVGPDIRCSMDPAELRLLVLRSKEIWTASKNPKKRSIPEDDVYRFARGSIVAEKNIMAGTILTESDIWARRPGTGEFSAAEFDSVIGRKVLKDIAKNTQLKRSDLWDA